MMSGKLNVRLVKNHNALFDFQWVILKLWQEFLKSNFHFSSLDNDWVSYIARSTVSTGKYCDNHRENDIKLYFQLVLIHLYLKSKLQQISPYTEMFII